jgi:hypothetical protein
VEQGSWPIDCQSPTKTDPTREKMRHNPSRVLLSTLVGS